MVVPDHISHARLDPSLEEGLAEVKMINEDGVCREMTADELAEQAMLDAEFFARKATIALSMARDLRDIKLSREVDPVVTNPLRWNALTSEKQAEWQAYRILLLDTPQQDGFPEDITWPTKPE
jgi:hypothetical protein